MVVAAQPQHENNRSNKRMKPSTIAASNLMKPSTIAASNFTKPSTANASKCFFFQKLGHKIAECRKCKAAEKAEKKGKDGDKQNQKQKGDQA